MSQFIEMTGDPRTNPKGWTVKKLPELASYSIGLTYKPEQVSESGTIVLRSGNIQNSKIDLTDVVRVDCPIKESIYVQKDDILMCSRNGSAALVGKVAQIKDINEPMTYGAFMTVIRSEYSDFLYLYFQSNDFREQVSTGKSSTMNQITQNMLDKISLPLPDGDTRKKLADILHQADKSEFDGFKSQFIEMFGNPQNNSQRRKTVRFDEVLTFQRGHDLPEKERKSEGAIPIYGSNGFVGYHTESKAKNGIVTGRSGTIGKVYCIKGDYWPLNTSLYSIDTHGNNLTYLKYMVEAFDVSRFSNGTGVPTLNRNDIHKEMIPLVDISEQEAFEVIAHQADKSENRRELRMAS